MKVIAGVIIVLALVSAVVPQLTNCASQGRALTLENGKTVPMKCFWTAEAALATAVPLTLLGGLMFFNKRKETQRALAVLGLALGGFLILLPTALIGVCAMPEMLCNSVMRPTMIFSGIITMVASGIAFALAFKGEALISAGHPV